MARTGSSRSQKEQPASVAPVSDEVKLGRQPAVKAVAPATSPVESEAPASEVTTSTVSALEADLPSNVSVGAAGTLFMEEAQPEPTTSFSREAARDTLVEALGKDWAREYEVFYHGSSDARPRLDIDDVPRGRVFTSATLETAELFAHRKTGRVGGRANMTAVIFDRKTFERAKSMRLLTTKQIDDMPGKVETILTPAAFDLAADCIPIPDRHGRL